MQSGKRRCGLLGGLGGQWDSPGLSRAVDIGAIPLLLWSILMDFLPQEKLIFLCESVWQWIFIYFFSISL